MKFKNYSFLFVLVLFFVLLSCAGPEREEINLAQVRKAIEEANLKFSEAITQGDAAAAAALYTEDTILLPPNSEMIQGRQETEAFWRALWAQLKVTDVNITIVDLYGNGDIVYEVGKYTLTIQPEGQEPIEDKGKYVVVWKLQADGSWKKHIDIWNSSVPAQP